jgi:hypothetical protein
MYINRDCNQFVSDMKAAGYEVEHYRGRLCYEGPAVRCAKYRYQSIERATSVQLQTDRLDDANLVVYPIRSGNAPNKKGRDKKTLLEAWRKESRLRLEAMAPRSKRPATRSDTRF